MHYTDPLKVAEKLTNLLGQNGSARRSGRSAGAGSVNEMLSGIYRIEPYPDTNQLLVFCRTEQSLSFLDGVIADLDQPTTIGLPFVVELKHANAIELGEELNALLSEAGAGMTIGLPGDGLSGRSDDGGVVEDAGPAGQFRFPWQNGGPRDDVTPGSPLIGRVRIVPIVRQNALAVLCPAPQREAVRELVEYFDRPGRQVMISAVIAEIELTDELNLGLRFSNSDDILSGSNPDYRLGTAMEGSASRDNILNDFWGLFNTSVLDAAFSVNMAIQALSQLTNVRILQEPIIFTADNQEALFFDGQEIPFITNTTINVNGQPLEKVVKKPVRMKIIEIHRPELEAAPGRRVDR